MKYLIITLLIISPIFVNAMDINDWNRLPEVYSYEINKWNGSIELNNIESRIDIMSKLNNKLMTREVGLFEKYETSIAVNVKRDLSPDIRPTLLTGKIYQDWRDSLLTETIGQFSKIKEKINKRVTNQQIK